MSTKIICDICGSENNCKSFTMPCWIEQYATTIDDKKILMYREVDEDTIDLCELHQTYIANLIDNMRKLPQEVSK